MYFLHLKTTTKLAQTNVLGVDCFAFCIAKEYPLIVYSSIDVSLCRNRVPYIYYLHPPEIEPLNAFMSNTPKPRPSDEVTS